MKMARGNASLDTSDQLIYGISTEVGLHQNEMWEG